MIINELHMMNFKSYKDTTISFNEGVTIITGENGAGTYSYLATVPVSATANPGYSFSNWEVISGGIVLSNQNTASTSFV